MSSAGLRRVFLVLQTRRCQPRNGRGSGRWQSKTFNTATTDTTMTTATTATTTIPTTTTTTATTSYSHYY